MILEALCAPNPNLHVFLLYFCWLLRSESAKSALCVWSAFASAVLGPLCPLALPHSYRLLCCHDVERTEIEQRGRK
jgi:hypothetical protein